MEGPDPIRFGQVSNHKTPERYGGSGGASQVNSPNGGPRRQGGRAIRVKDRIRRKERGLAEGNLLGDVSFGLLTGLEPLEIAADAYDMRLGFFSVGVNPRNVTETNAVKHFGFFDGPRGERLILALESAEDNRVGLQAGLHGLYIFGP